MFNKLFCTVCLSADEDKSARTHFDILYFLILAGLTKNGQRATNDLWEKKKKTID